MDYFSGGMEADTNDNYKMAVGAPSSYSTYDPATGLFVTKNNAPTEKDDFLGEIGTMLGFAVEGLVETAKLPFKAAEAVAEKAKSLLIYLIAGIVIVGIVVVFAHGAGSKFAGRVMT